MNTVKAALFPNSKNAILIMSGKTYKSVWVHLVWSTKYRRSVIVPSVKIPLYNEIKSIAQREGIYLDSINGGEDHIHLLIGLHPSQCIDDIVKVIKGNSWNWARKQPIFKKYLTWQTSYGAFSVCTRHVDQIRNYIANHEKHHAKVSFDDEMKMLEEKQVPILYQRRFD